MKVSINRQSAIPIHDQLVTQIALLIASAALPPGRRLPSVRDLANRLDVHRNTISAVYKTLEGYGVVAIKAGSGVRVIDAAGYEAAQTPTALGKLAARFVREARDRGHDDGAIREAIASALAPEVLSRIVVADPHPDFHPLYLAELGQRFSVPLAAATFEDLQADRDALEDAVLLCSMYHVSPLRAVVGPERRIIVFQVATPEPLLAQLRTLKAGATIGLVSVSETLIRMAKEIIAGLRGEELLVLEAHPDDEGALKALGRFADVVMLDTPSEGQARRFTHQPVFHFRLIPPESLAALAEQLPAGALAADAEALTPLPGGGEGRPKRLF